MTSNVFIDMLHNIRLDWTPGTLAGFAAAQPARYRTGGRSSDISEIEMLTCVKAMELTELRPLGYHLGK